MSLNPKAKSKPSLISIEFSAGFYPGKPPTTVDTIVTSFLKRF